MDSNRCSIFSCSRAGVQDELRQAEGSQGDLVFGGQPGRVSQGTKVMANILRRGRSDSENDLDYDGDIRPARLTR